MKMRTCLTLCSLCLVTAVCRAEGPQYFQPVRSILQAHCTDCHGKESPEAMVNLAEPAENAHLWYRVLDQLKFGTMPPKNEKQLSAADRKKLIAWIEGELTARLAAKQLREGRSRFRRLSRAEYANTFEDLFGIRPDVSKLPEDGRIGGYTKVSQALPMSTDGAYGYYEVARELLDDWVLTSKSRGAQPPDKKSRTHRLAALASGQSKGHTLELPDDWWVSFNTDDTSGRLQFGKYGGPKPNGFSNARIPGIHKIRAHVYAYQSDKPLTFGIYTGVTWAYPQKIQLAQIAEAPPGQPAIVETEVFLDKHDRFRLVPFGLGVQVPKNHQASKCKGPGLAIQWVEVIEPSPPHGDQWMTADLPDELYDELAKLKGRDRHNPQLKAGITDLKSTDRESFLAVLRATLQRIMPRIYRRDPLPAEVDQLVDEAAGRLDAGQYVHRVYLDTIATVLTSPDFLCVIERPGVLSDFALAARLSHFLWNTAPDEQLLAVARAGELHEPAVLRRQTERLLCDPRSQRFVQDFLNQWLDLHAINDTTPDGKVYPEYDDVLKFSSVLETENTFARILQENRSVRDFVAPDWVLANARLARHYGLEGVTGAELRPVKLPPDSPYGGIWTQPAILKVTADGSSTSPVKRGVWIAKRLLGVHISPPPPNIEPINPDTRGATTIREQLALHSRDATCASCHRKFDPYGFALENFDVMGQFRTKYRVLDEELASLRPHERKGKQLWLDGLQVDASGITPDGQQFQDITQLRQQLVRQPEKLAWGVTWHLVTYATATPSGPLDRSAIQAIVDQARSDEYGLRSLVHGVVQSKLFRSK